MREYLVDDNNLEILVIDGDVDINEVVFERELANGKCNYQHFNENDFYDKLEIIFKTKVEADGDILRLELVNEKYKLYGNMESLAEELLFESLIDSQFFKRFNNDYI